MISKIFGRFQITPGTEPLRHISKTSNEARFQNSITSLRIRPLYSWIFTAFNLVWGAIKSLFCCYRNAAHHNSEFKPEIDPNILSSRDPFYRTLFDSNHALKHPEAYKLGCEIFDILGKGGVFRWLYYKSTLEAKKKEILSYNIHPLESLYLLYHNRGKAKLVCHFVDNSPSSIKSRFLQEYADNFVAYSNPIKPQIPGFCKLLSLNETDVRTFVNKQNWKEFIQYVHKNRKKHFNL